MREHAYADPARASGSKRSSTRWSARKARGRCRRRSTAGVRCIVFDIPLLVESGRWRSQVDRVLVVDCSPRDAGASGSSPAAACTPEAVRAIMAAQATRAQRLAAADIVICNEGLSLEQLRDKVVQVARSFGL